MELIVGLDPTAGESGREMSPVAVAVIAAAAGADALHATFRLDKSGGIRESDLIAVRDAADRPVYLESLPSIASVRPALALRPDVLVLGPERRGTPGAALDPSLSGSGLESAIREASAAGIPVYLRVPPQLAAVRAAHRLGVKGLVFPPTALDLAAEDADAISEASRAATKLKLRLVVGPVDALRSIECAKDVVPGGAVLLGAALLERAVLLGLPAALGVVRERL
jgi:pyridoxine 5'-phosphate synthase PdxJ